MRCYGCNSQYHFLRDCPVIQRPAEVKVELQNVFDIEEKVESLSKFAIFRTKDQVNIHALREAMTKEFWEFGWQGKIFPIDNQSYLVGFVDEVRRDLAVIAGRKKYEGFSGTLYPWNEDRGTIKVLRPVIIWLTLEGLPLHFWGKEEIASLIAPFGKIHKLGENFYNKMRADVVKVMVEVDDLSVIPRKIECSYKGVRDNKYRFYSVNVVPAPSYLPVSQWTEGRYNSYVDEGGSHLEIEEGWSEGWSRRGEAARRRAEDAGDGAVDMPAFAGHVLGVHAPANQAELNARSQEQLNARSQAPPMETRGGTHGDDLRALAKDEEERRRKGKGIMVGGSVGPKDNMDPGPLSSGSGSWDPNDVGGQQEQEPLSSHDADSKADKGDEKGQAKERPIVISDGSQDEDLGGEGGFTTEVHVPAIGMVKKEGEGIKKHEGRMEEGGEEGKGTKRVSRGSTHSVPPGFVRRQKSVSGGASPFGKLQKGGFKFLKRSSTSVSSGARQGSPVPPKKNKPLSAMSDKEMEEAAANVGVEKELGAEQRERFRALEKDRASS